MEASQFPDKYLGLPTLIGRNKGSTFNGIKENVWIKLQRWQGKFFFNGGKQNLIKVVT